MEHGRRTTQGKRALLLNGSGEPLHICDAGRALILVLNGKADVVLNTDIVVRSQYSDFYLPSIIVLRRYVKIPRGRSIPLTRRTVAETRQNVALPRARGPRNLPRYDRRLQRRRARAQ